MPPQASQLLRRGLALMALSRLAHGLNNARAPLLPPPSQLVPTRRLQIIPWPYVGVDFNKSSKLAGVGACAGARAHAADGVQLVERLRLHA